MYNIYMKKVYIAIDLKSFYASVECVERGLDPLKARLVVADESRTNKTICLAVSPALKELGVSGRARLYEVFKKAPKGSFIIAKPQMKKYMSISAKIFEIYASFVAAEDMHVYSVDEVFIDATSYLKNYNVTAHGLARMMIGEVLKQTGITATAGIGSNLYLAKIAMDIEAKHMKPDKDGVRIAELDEKSYRTKLWDHQPITDFWRIGQGYKKRLANLGIHTMGELARYSLTGSDKLYATFGKNAELLIDHAWGYEPVEIKDIKNYVAENHSISMGQVLAEPYNYKKARNIMLEMVDALTLDLVNKQLITDQIVLTVVYDISVMKKYTGKTQRDYYGRTIPKHAHGTVNLGYFNASFKTISEKCVELFDRIVNRELLVRRIYVVANHVRYESMKAQPTQLNLFVDLDERRNELERESKRQRAILKIKHRYGKNAILRGINFEDGATMRERNQQVGGHKA